MNLEVSLFPALKGILNFTGGIKMSDSIALVGMMGCGKSLIGRKVAKILDLEYIDMDEEFEKVHGAIEKYFKVHGEKRFREIESSLLQKFAEKNGIVLSTGGGIIESSVNRKIMNGFKTFYLEEDPELLWSRISLSNRPLVREGKDAFMSRFVSRKPFYEAYERICGTNLTPDQIAAKIVKLYVNPKDIIEIDSYQRVRIVHNINFDDPDLSIVSKNVKEIWEIKGTGIDDGEALKSIAGAEQLWRIFLQNGLSRKSKVRGVGGGTLTDTTGFAATTYMRGMNLELMPTTLLGMVDASIGGKFAVNFNGIKNLIGTFGRPDVLIDPIYALSLNDERFREGLVESIKIGAVFDGEFFEYIEKNINKILERNLSFLDEIVSIAVKDKLEIVSKDPEDKNLRHILNFGHTIGHAIEGSSKNEISHGRAVGIGMIIESEKFSPQVHERIESIMGQLGFKYDKFGDLERWISMDKKKEESRIIIPVVERIGYSQLKTIEMKNFSDR
jgi:shikimate kinase/3-dehydroquinate synthase